MLYDPCDEFCFAFALLSAEAATGRPERGEMRRVLIELSICHWSFAFVA